MRVAIVAVLLALAGAIPAHAQTKEPLPTFVVDARLLIAKLTEDAVTAGDLGLAPTALPTTALGGAIGADVYFLRDKKVKLGLGGEAVIGRATSNVTDATGAVTGPRVERRVQGFAGTFSLNFGHRQ